MVAPGVIDTDMSNFTKTEAGRAVVMGMQESQADRHARRGGFGHRVPGSRTRCNTGSIGAVDGGSKL
jgi:3-oxoacyl-[acyl-carrier protein] reductase